MIEQILSLVAGQVATPKTDEERFHEILNGSPLNAIEEVGLVAVAQQAGIDANLTTTLLKAIGLTK